MSHMAGLQRQETRSLWAAVALGHRVVPLCKTPAESRALCVPILLLLLHRVCPKRGEAGK